MGFLKIFGRALNFEESKEYFDFIKDSAFETVIQCILSTKDKKCCPKFGYEVFVIYQGRNTQNKN